MQTRRILVGCDFTYVAAVNTPVIFQVQPAESAHISIENGQWASEPAVAIRSYTDLYRNPCLRAVLPAGRSSFRYQAVAVVPDLTEEVDEDAPECAPDALPDETLIYILPSRYCLPDVLGDEAWSRFGGLRPGYRRVLNIPARYVFGYLPDLDVPPDPAPMDFAAWMEVWLGDQWWTFDPRNNTRRKGRIVIGRGRDASDVAMATTFGGPLLESMVVQAEEAAR